MVAQYDEVGTFGSSGLGQFNLKMAGDFTKPLILENLQPGSQTRHNSGMHCIACLGKQVIWGFHIIFHSDAVPFLLKEQAACRPLYPPRST